MAELEVVNQQKNIENSVSIERISDVNNFYNALDDAKKNQTVYDDTGRNNYYFLVQDVFENQGETTLNTIKANLTSKISDPKIDWTKEDDPTVKTFTQALNAFETDLTEYYSKRKQNKDSEKGKTNDVDKSGDLKYELNLVKSIKKMITDKQTKINEEKKTEEKNKETASNLLSLNYATKEMADRFFEQTEEADFDVTMEEIYTACGGTNGSSVNITATENGKGKKLIKMVQAYAKTENIKKIELGKSSDSYCSSYVDGTRAIKFTIETTTDGKITSKEKDIVRGPQKELQKKRAKKTAQDIDFETKRTETSKDLNMFDEKGNFEAFRMFLERKDATFVKENLGAITKQINDYKPTGIDVDENLNELKNGYGDVLTDYVIGHYTKDLMNTYIDYLTDNNLNILGADQTARNENYNKLIESWNKTGFRKDLPKETKQRLIDLQATINNIKPPKTAVEALNQGLDNLINTFGPMLFNILKYFGIGKTTLLKRFPGIEKKINDLYQKEYGLSDGEISAVIELSREIDPDAKPLEDEETKKSLMLNTAETIKSAFNSKKDTKSKYIDALITNKDYYEHINVDILKTALETYNKENNKQLNINDVIKTEKDKKTGKETITEIKKDKEFRNLIETILDTESTRENIASANNEIQAPSEKNAAKNEHNQEIGTGNDAERYQIKSLRDIARYLTASLYTTKDLAYTMTENGLHNQKKLTNQPSNGVENNNNELTFKNQSDDFTTDKKISAKGADKKIEDVIDMKNAPEKITVTRKDGTIVNGVRSTTYTDATDNKTPITTYVLDNDNKTRVNLMAGDTIAAVPETTNTADTSEPDIQKDYLNTDGTLKGVSAKRIDQIFNDFTKAPKNLLITPKGTTTAKKIELGKATVNGKEIDTYVYSDNTKTRVKIHDGDKIEAVAATAETTEIAINTKRETIETNLNDTKKSTNKTNFEKTDYALYDKNTYQTEIIKLSELFTDKDNYKKLIAEKITIEDIASVTNITHLKNMLTYRKLKSTKETENETFKGVKDFYYNKLTNIDPTKQTYEVTATEKDGIQITAKESGTKKFTITIKNTDGKMSTGRKDETAQA